MRDDAGSSDLVELARRSDDAHNRRDFEALSSLLSPDVVYRPIPGFTDNRERRGRDDVVRFQEEFFGVWAEDFVSKLDSVRVHGDAVVARIVFTGHARTSGAEISGRIFEVFFFRDGLIRRIEDFTDRDEALKAVAET